MKNQLQAPAIKSAMKKASQLSASLAPVNTTLTSADGVCMDGGSITVTGTDDSTVSTTVYDVTITFNNCRDYVIDYTELSGSMRLVENTVIGSSSDTSLTVTNFSEKIYSDSLYTFLSSADVLNGSFSSIDDMTSGSNTASGSYSSTDYVGQLAMSFTFSGLRDDWIDTETLTTPATGTIQDTVNGTFSFIATDTSSGFSAGFTFGMTDFTDQITYNADGTTDEWWDGSIGMSWNPPVAGCLAGTITFTTQVDDPMHYSSQDLSICPVSGTLTANNATIQFGTSGAVLSPAVKVTVGTVSTTYTDCHSLGGGSICTM